MKIGYARVSTHEQSLDLQIDALLQDGCEESEIVTDKVSGVKAERPGLDSIKMKLRKGDTLVVWKLNRLGRSLKNLIQWANYLEEKGVALRSITENIDTSSSTGRLVFHIFGAMAEFERDIIRERTLAGLASARKRGLKGGRKPSLSRKKKEEITKLYESKTVAVTTICEMYGIARPTFYRYVREVNPDLIGK